MLPRWRILQHQQMSIQMFHILNPSASVQFLLSLVFSFFVSGSDKMPPCMGDREARTVWKPVCQQYALSGHGHNDSSALQFFCLLAGYCCSKVFQHVQDRRAGVCEFSSVCCDCIAFALPEQTEIWLQTKWGGCLRQRNIEVFCGKGWPSKH